jgi:hypothetical protein
VRAMGELRHDFVTQITGTGLAVRCIDLFHDCPAAS